MAGKSGNKWTAEQKAVAKKRMQDYWAKRKALVQPVSQPVSNPPIDPEPRKQIGDRFEDYPQETSSPVRREEDEEIPPNLFDGQRKTFEIMGRNGSFSDPIPGYYLYWFIDRGDGRLMMAKRSGYEFVEYEEVLLNESIISGNDDLGGHVRKFSKEVLDGKPVYQYLMKKPLWLKAKHDEEFEKIHIRQEDELQQGRISKNEKDKQYAPGQYPGSKLPKIVVGSSFARPKP